MDTELLLDAAQRVFSKSGMSGASIRAIALEAGCDPALIYYHFESKEAMFLEIFDLVPAIAERIADLPANQALVMAERAWFELFWRGVAAHPAKPLPHDLFSVE